MHVQDYAVGDASPLALDVVVGQISEISTLPHVAMRLMEVANDPNSSVIDLRQVVENDAALSTRILRCVNSSAYGVREPVTNLQQAISYLGLKRIRNLALTASVADLFNHDEVIGAYSRPKLWQHLVAVGIGARLVAMRQGMAEFEDAFAAGLLHDIGIVLEDQYMHDAFREVIESLDDATPLVELERQRWGFDHAQLGARVGTSWHLPDRICSSIAYHHESASCDGEDAAVVRCVEVANLICTVKGYSSVGRKLIDVSKPVLDAMGLSREHITVLAQDLDEDLAKNAPLFDL